MLHLQYSSSPHESAGLGSANACKHVRGGHARYIAGQESPAILQRSALVCIYIHICVRVRVIRFIASAMPGGYTPAHIDSARHAVEPPYPVRKSYMKPQQKRTTRATWCDFFSCAFACRERVPTGFLSADAHTENKPEVPKRGSTQHEGRGYYPGEYLASSPDPSHPHVPRGFLRRLRPDKSARPR